MNNELLQAMTALTGRLLALAGRDPEFKSSFRAFAEALLDTPELALDEIEADHPDDLGAAGMAGTSLALAGAGPAESPRSAFGRSPGQASAEPASAPPRMPREWSPPRFEPGTPGPEWDENTALLDVVTRCRMKAEGARWAATRQRKIQQGVDFRAEVAPRDREVIDKAGSIPGCFLWTNTANFRPPEDLRLMESLAECFEVMAEAVQLVLAVLGSGPRPRRNLIARSLELLAETQSALRVAILRVGGSSDSDQFKVYQWIRQVANAEGHFIHRYMKLEDPADPTRAPWTRNEIAAMMGGFQQQGQRERQRDSRYKTLRFHVSRVGKSDGDDYHWSKVVEHVHEAIAFDNVSTNSVELRELLAPIWDLLPERDDYPTGFAEFRRDMDHYLEEQAGSPASSTSPMVFTRSPEVRDVARLLAGRPVVMIGGPRQPHAQASLAAAFDLSELIWIDSKEPGADEAFRSAVARADVALVILAVRWSSPSLGDIQGDCEQHGKPLVRLPAGYNAEQIAAQVLAQCADQLRPGPRPHRPE